MDEAFLKGYDILKIPIVEGGASAWPERFSLSRISEIRARAGEEAFASQMMLDPAAPGRAYFDASRLVFYDEPFERREANGALEFTIGSAKITHCSCWWDPAYAIGDGDESVAACALFDDEGTAYLHDILYIRASDREASSREQCRAVAGFIARNFAPAICVETNGIGKFLPEYLRMEILSAGLGAFVRGVNSSRAKAVRIVDAFSGVFLDGKLRVSSSVRSTPWVLEFSEWSPDSKAHDDGVDAAAGALSACPEKLPFRTARGNARSFKKRAARIANWRGNAKSYLE